jgi:hypothetical protein
MLHCTSRRARETPRICPNGISLRTPVSLYRHGSRAALDAGKGWLTGRSDAALEYELR